MTNMSDINTNQNTNIEESETKENNHHNESDCVFCKIIDGTIPSHKIYEDDETLAILDIAPTNYGHVLVLSKDHFENIYTMPQELACRMMMTTQKMATAVRNGVDADGINIIMNNETAAGQIIFHAHIHVVPRLNEDGFKHWPHKEYKDEEEKMVYVEKIKNEI